MKTAPMKHIQTNSCSGEMKSDNTAVFVYKISTLEKFLNLVDCQHLSHMLCEQIPCTFYKLYSVLLVYHSFLPHSAMTPSSIIGIC